MRRLGVLGITLLGLLTLWQSVTYLGFTIPFNSERGLLRFALTALPAAVSLAVSLVLLFWRRPLASRLFDDEPLDFALYPVPILRLALIVFSVSLIARSVPQVAAWGVTALALRQEAPLEPLSLVDQLVVPVVATIVGLGLAAFSRPLAVRLWGNKREQAAEPVERCQNCGTPYDLQDYRPDVIPRCDTCGEQLPRPGA